MHPRTTDMPSARSPFAGCAILIAAVLVMGFLIVFSTVTLFRQYDEIVKFTSDRPQPVEVSSLEDQETTLNPLAERLEAFRQTLGSGNQAALELTAAELNLCIAAFEPLKELRGTFRIIEILDDGSLRIAISFPLNGKPRFAKPGETGWLHSDPRYLNATLVARPTLLKREIVLQISHIEVPNAQVPREFTEQMSPYRLAERYLNDPTLGPAMAAITRISTENGKITFSHMPGETRSDAISDQQVDHASGKFFTVLGVFATLFLIFAATVLFLAHRAKSRHR